MSGISKIAIVGTGAIGGYYGARLARSGVDTRFLARSDFAVLRERGLRVRTPNEDWRVYPLEAYTRPEEIGPCDLVVVCLKATSNGALAKLVPPLLGSDTAILTLENGLGSDELLAEQFGAERVIGGLCFIAVNRVEPGELWCVHPGSISIAEFRRPVSSRLSRIAELFTQAGVKCLTCDNLEAIRWKKLVWNVPFNGLSIAAGGITTDKILANPALVEETRALMGEVIAAAAKFGHGIPQSFIEQQISITYPMGPYKPSSLIDYLAGREVEVEAIWGEPLRRAEAAGIAMPRLAALYAKLKELTRASGHKDTGR